MSELVDSAALARRVREHRAALGLSLRAASDEAGVPFNTLSRAERGHLPDLANFARLLTWTGQDLAEVFRVTAKIRPGSTVDTVRDLLHSDPLLTEEAADRIAGLIEQLYSALATAPTGVVHLRAAATLTPRAAVLLGDLTGRLVEAAAAREFEPGWAS